MKQTITELRHHAMTSRCLISKRIAFVVAATLGGLASVFRSTIVPLLFAAVLADVSVQPLWADTTQWSAMAKTPEATLEPAVVLRSAADILPERLLNGSNHSVRDEVMARGFVHYYVIETPYGEFLAAGDGEVRERIREIDAIAALRRLSKSEVLTESASDAAKRSYVAAKEVIEEPWETAKAIPSGLTRLFKRSKRQVEDAYDDVSAWYKDGGVDDAAPQNDEAHQQKARLSLEKIRKAADFGIDEGQDYLKGSLGFNREFRRLARQLGVDPYTRNAVLRQELISMSWTATAGSFAANIVLPEVPAPIGLLQNTRELVWNTKAFDLRLRNEEAVERMDVESSQREAFFNNERFTLSDQTRLVQAIERLRGVRNRGQLVADAARAESREETRFFVRSAELLALYHERRAPIEELIDDGHTPVAAQDLKGRLVVVLPLDYVNWSRLALDTATVVHGSLRARDRGVASEVWVEGTVTPRARRELLRLGWTVQDRALGAFDRSATVPANAHILNGD